MDKNTSQEEFQKDFERIPKLEENIKHALQQYTQIYLTDDKLVFIFEEYSNVEAGIEQLKARMAKFTTHASLKEYGETRNLEIAIPNNDAIFIRLSADKIHSLAMKGFRSLGVEPKKISIDFSFSDHATISVDDEVYLVYEKVEV